MMCDVRCEPQTRRDVLPPEELEARKKAVKTAMRWIQALSLVLMVLGAVLVAKATLLLHGSGAGLAATVAVAVGGTIADCIIGVLFGWYIARKLEPVYAKFCDAYDKRHQ